MTHGAGHLPTPTVPAAAFAPTALACGPHPGVPTARLRLFARAAGGLLWPMLLLSGCAVGPRFTRPHPPAASAYTPSARPLAVTPGYGEPSQQLVVGEAIPAQWWGLFHNAALDQVLRQALTANPTLAAARATLAEARQAVRAARGAYAPQIDLGAGAERQKGPAFALGLLSNLPVKQGLTPFDLYSLGPTVSYAPDVFGLQRRSVEARQAAAAVQHDQLAAAVLTITGNAVETALRLASLHRQIHAVRQIIADDSHNLALVRRAFRLGRAPRTAVLAAETRLALDAAQLPALRERRALAQDALAILVGRVPGQWQPPVFRLADFQLPATLPLTLPSTLARQRPDILAAEQQVHLRSAAVGIATARLYPNIVLSASIATAALRPSALFGASSGIWAVLSGLTAPVFHGGTLRAERSASVDALKASLALYRQTVLAAFGQVTDTLRALDNDAQLAAEQHEAMRLARTALALQRVSYRAGRSNVLDLLAAERRYEQARLGYAQSSAQRYADSAQLLVALGGGWWNDPHLCADRCAIRAGAETHSAGAGTK